MWMLMQASMGQGGRMTKDNEAFHKVNKGNGCTPKGAEADAWGSSGKPQSAAGRDRCLECARKCCPKGAACTFSNQAHLQQNCHTSAHPKFPCRSSKSTNQRLLHS
jgi:hypothetical protein